MTSREKKLLVVGVVLIVLLVLGNALAFFFLYQELGDVEDQVGSIEESSNVENPPIASNDYDYQQDKDVDPPEDDSPNTPPEEVVPPVADRYQVINWDWSFNLGDREVKEIPIQGWEPKDYLPVDPYIYRVVGTVEEQEECPREEIGVSMARYYGNEMSEEENHMYVLTHGSTDTWELYNVTTTLVVDGSAPVYTIPAQNLGDSSKTYIFRNGNNREYYYHIWTWGIGEFYAEDPGCGGKRYEMEEKIAEEIIRTVRFE